MEQSPNLALPYIMPSQAQKHVTHNEAIRTLDAMVQLTVIDRDLAAPPASPAEGDRYIVAAAPTGAWAGHAHDLAVWQDGAWALIDPRIGWLAWITDEGRLCTFNGTVWIDALEQHVNPIGLVGVNATATTTNRLSVKSPAVLLDAETASHRVAINKAASADTGSVVFQTGYSGRAEFGLAGSDDWSVKVSPNGSSWVEALKVDAATGRVRLPAALALSDSDQAVARRHVRELLTANRTYHVRTDGSDANTGLADTAGGAFLTIQKAIDVTVGLDLSIYAVTIQVGAGTYTGPVRTKPYVGAGPITLRGDTTTPANCIIATTSNTAVSNANDTAVTGWTLTGFRLQTTTSGHCISISLGSLLVLGVMDFGASAGAHCLAASGAIVRMNSNYAITGGATYHMLAAETAVIFPGDRTVTLTGTPAFSTAFAAASRNAVVNAANMIFSGTATGKRYSVDTGAIVHTNGGGASYFPGSTAGTATTPGAYT